MEKLTILKGMIKGMKLLGAEFVKINNSTILFNIPNNSEINDKNKLLRASNAFNKMLSLKLKIRNI